MVQISPSPPRRSKVRFAPTSFFEKKSVPAPLPRLRLAGNDLPVMNHSSWEAQDMAESVFGDKATVPDEDRLNTALGDSKALWNKINSVIFENKT